MIAMTHANTIGAKVRRNNNARTRANLQMHKHGFEAKRNLRAHSLLLCRPVGEGQRPDTRQQHPGPYAKHLDGAHAPVHGGRQPHGAHPPSGRGRFSPSLAPPKAHSKAHYGTCLPACSQPIPTTSNTTPVSQECPRTAQSIYVIVWLATARRVVSSSNVTPVPLSATIDDEQTSSSRPGDSKVRFEEAATERSIRQTTPRNTQQISCRAQKTSPRRRRLGSHLRTRMRRTSICVRDDLPTRQ